MTVGKKVDRFFVEKKTLMNLIGSKRKILHLQDLITKTFS